MGNVAIALMTGAAYEDALKRLTDEEHKTPQIRDRVHRIATARKGGRRRSSSDITQQRSSVLKSQLTVVAQSWREVEDRRPCFSGDFVGGHGTSHAVHVLMRMYDQAGESARKHYAEMRMLSLLIAHSIEQCVEKHPESNKAEAINRTAEELGVADITLRRIEFRGSWYMDLAERIGLGVLPLLGPVHDKIGRGVNRGNVSDFETLARSLDGFESRADQLSTQVKTALLGHARSSELEIDPDSRLGILLSTGEPLRRDSAHTDADCDGSSGPSSSAIDGPSICQNVSTDELTLLRLLCHLETNSIPLAMLHRGVVAQSRWDEFGVRVNITPTQTGVSDEILRAADRSLLEARLINLQQAQILDVSDASIDVRPSARMATLQALATMQKAIFWEEQACAMVCHAFPRGTTLDSEYDTIAPCFLPQVLSLCDRGFKYHDSSDMAATLLSAAPMSKSSGPELDKHLDAVLSTLKYSHLHVWRARRTYKTRRSRSMQEWEAIFAETTAKYHRSSTSTSVRGHAQMGHFVAVHADYLCRYKSISSAEKLLATWTPLSPSHPSELERTILCRKDFVNAKILRYRGQDSKALQILARLKDSSLVKERAFQVDVFNHIAELTADANIIRDLPPGQSTTWRDAQILLSCADGQFERGDFENALDTYSSARKHAYNDIQRVRAMIGVSKTRHSRNDVHLAEMEWLNTEQVVNELGWQEGFTSGLIHLSLGELKHDLRRSMLGTELLKQTDSAMWLVGGYSWVRKLVRSRLKEQDVALPDL